ncbi:11822_t:CDS:2 [Gigaspora margarita]|uniref:11822_t:CDS:1 n=1 Tax=Gigaspora margarita TaxID=4874 RepID=A0ABN7VDR7_GIGMA|nr:11822_t:CDS:2 [Gigaspora margarita]
MAGYKRNQDSFQAFNSNDSESNLITINSREAQQKRCKRPEKCTENNDKESICWKYFEPFKAPKENGTITKCSIPGCTTKYIWSGSTSNLVRHLKTKHGIIKSSMTLASTTSVINFASSESEINLPLLKFIVSSGAPFSIVDSLKSAGFVNPKIELSTSDIIEEQINKVYNHLFLQLKSKAQQEKYVILSIREIVTETKFDESHVVFTCNWLTKDFKLYKILLLVKLFCSEIDNDKCFYGDIIEALEKWELTNLKFYSDNCDNFFKSLWGWKDEKYQNLMRNFIRLHENKNDYFNDLRDLIQRNLEKWAGENTNTQRMSETISSIKNATKNLHDIVDFLKNDIIQKEIQNMLIYFNYSTIIDIQNAEKINCGCIYHEMAFLKLMEKPFLQLVNNYDSYKTTYTRKQGKYFKGLLLDFLPFSIFSILLQLFKPLEYITCNKREISSEDYIDLIDKIITNVDNMLREHQFSDYLEHKILKSFLRSISLYFECNDLFAEPLALFLDPRSNPDEISAVIIKWARKKCQAYYLKNIFSDNLDRSVQAANKELECYINRPQLSLDGTIDPYEWWQGSKQMLPGLASLAREYLPILTVDNEDPIKNLDKLLKTYDGVMAEKIAFLQYNINYIDLY